MIARKKLCSPHPLDKNRCYLEPGNPRSAPVDWPSSTGPWLRRIPSYHIHAIRSAGSTGHDGPVHFQTEGERGLGV